MPDPRPIYTITSQPGIQRDGTVLDSQAYTDGQWVRFQRGKPKKMGGYKALAENIPTIARGAYGYYKNGLMYLYSFGENQASLVTTPISGVSSVASSSALTDLTASDLYTYQVDSLYDQTGVNALIIAHAAENVDDIANSTDTNAYYAVAGDSSPNWYKITTVGAAELLVSGGICVLQPFVFAYGDNGLIKNSNANDPNDWEIRVGGEANEANVSAYKVVKGMAMRGSGSAPAGLFWALDSLIRVSFVGGSAVWRYDTLSNQTSILSPHSVIEYDGVYYWIGMDRFLMFNGNVQEIPNTTNLNFFFDSLNYTYRTKVWAMKVPKFGEIWWFFPKDGATECNHAIVLNVREKVWYDVELSRSAGIFSQVFTYPVMYGNEFDDFTVTDTNLAQAGGPSTIQLAAAASAVDDTYNGYTIEIQSGTGAGQTREISDYTGATRTATTSIAWATQPDNTSIYTLSLTTDATRCYAHEYGRNKIENGEESVIPSYFTTHDFGLPTGSVAGESPQGQDYWTRLTRIEPDFIQEGNMTVSVISEEFANATSVESSPYTFDTDTTKIDMRENCRNIRLKFRSAELNGHYEMGRVLLHTEPGDIRS